MAQRRDTRENEEHRRRRRGCGPSAAVMLLIVLLLAGAIGVVEYVRRSEFLVQKLLAEVQAATGFVATADEVRVSWRGSTIIENLVLRMPLSDDPTLSIQRFVVEHDPLLWVMLRRGTDIDTITARGAIIRVVEHAPEGSGPGSLTRELDRLLASLPSGDDDGRPPAIPAIAIPDAKLILVPLEGEPLALDLSVGATPVESLGVRFQAAISDLLVAEGEAVVGGGWSHTVRARIDPGPDVWAQIRRLGELPETEPPSLSATWTGRAEEGGVRGLLHINDAAAGPYSAAGAVRVSLGEIVEAQPQTLRLSAPDLPAVTLQSGAVALDGNRLRVRSLVAEGADQVLEIDGSFDTDAMSGRADVSFRGQVGGAVTHHGLVEASLRAPGGRPVLEGTLSGVAQLPDGRLVTDARFRAAGPDWRRLTATLSFPELRYHSGEETWDAAGLALRAALHPDRVELESLRAPDASTSIASGVYAFETGEWSLTARLGDWRPQPEVKPIDLSLEGRGLRGAIESLTFQASGEEFDLTGEGAFDPQNPKPLVLSVEAAVSREALAEEASAEAAPGPGDLSGAITGTFALEGTLQPLQLEGGARLLTQRVRMREMEFDDIELLGTAAFNSEGMTFASEEFSLLEGLATVTAQSDREGDIDAEFRVTRADLAPLSALLGLDAPLEGRATATIAATAPDGRFGALTARGEWEVENLVAGPIKAERGRGTARYADGVVEIEEATLTSGDGRVIAQAIVPLDDLSSIDASVRAASFPIEAGALDFAVSGRVEGTVDLPSAGGDLQIDGSTEVSYNGVRIATVGADGSLDQRTLRLETIDGSIGDGALSGAAVIPLDNFTESTARLTLRDLEPRYFEALVPQSSEVLGRVSGELVLAPTTDERAPEPLRLDVDFSVAEGSWRGVLLESLSLEAYLGNERSVLERGVAQIADGSVSIWGSTNDHAGERYVQASGDVRRIDLAQVVSALAPDADSYAGRISAGFSGAGYLEEPHRLFGQATVTVEESDLADVPLINNLYALFKGGAAGSQPQGVGVAEMRLDGETLHLPRVQYFNRGLEIRASLEVADIYRAGESPIAGVAVGAARPLAGAELSITGDVDRMLSAAQEGGAVARINGTLAQPRTRIIPFAELQSFLGRVLGASPE